MIRAASGGIAQRLTQTTVIFVVLAASTAAALLGLTLVTNANVLFFRAVAAAHGADVAAIADSARATGAQLAATRRVAGVTRAAGPYPAATVMLTAGGQTYPSFVIVGRAARTGPLDDLTLNQGRWATRPGEIDLAIYAGARVPIGGKVTVANAPGQPKLTVVGYAGSVVRDEDGWVAPAEVQALRPRGAPPERQMLYTFSAAGTPQQISSDVAALKAALPAGTITGYVSWLSAADQTGPEQSINTPFAVAFALLALVLGLLITANVVSGAVVAGYRRIGVLKSIGFTPAQVAAAYLAQIGAPAVAGCLAGTVLGSWWVVPRLNQGSPFKVAPQAVPAWISVTVPLGMCALAGLAALVPALRAARRSAVGAIATGQAPRQGHGYAASGLAGKIALPRPVTIGLAAPFARPARSAAIIAAIMSGVTAVVLAVGLNSSFAKVAAVSDVGQGQVQVGRNLPGFGATLSASQDRKVEAALRAQPGTLRYVAETDLGPGARPSVRVADLQPSADLFVDPGTSVSVTAYDGDPGWLGWQLVRGSWYHGRGEVDVNAAFLAATGLSVGDAVPVAVSGGRTVTARIAGEVFDAGPPGMLTSWQALGGTASGLAVGQYDIALRPGTSARAYAAAITRALGRAFVVTSSAGQEPGGGPFGLVDESMIHLMTLLVAVLAALGVLTPMVMVTRERVHDLGVFKAMGMTPRQTIVMVACWVVVPAAAAALIAIPAAIVVHSVTMQAIGGVERTGMPASVVHVYRLSELALLAMSGFAIAAAGALLPAGWAAASKTVTALRAE